MPESTTPNPTPAAGSPKATGSPTPGPSQAGSRLPERVASSGARLRTDRGTTQISDAVVSKIAALATKEIPGVQDMGKSLSRAFGSLRSKVPGVTADASTQGISVEVGERQAAVDIDIVIYYGQSVVEVSEAVRSNVIDRIESMTGLEVTEVNIAVDDLYLEGSQDDAPSRVE